MIQSVIFDFDGVVLDSMPIKDKGFELLFADFDKASVDKILEFHQNNGGISRFVKIRYFFEKILGESITEGTVMEYADRYSKLMLAELTDKKYIIQETVDFIKSRYRQIPMHVASGTEERETRYICECLGLSQYFVSVYGSPRAKNDVVKSIIEENGYDRYQVVMIGDSRADYDAAKHNGLIFCGFNSERMREFSDFYIEDYASFEKQYIG